MILDVKKVGYLVRTPVVKCRYKTVYRFDAETDLELTLRKL